MGLVGSKKKKEKRENEIMKYFKKNVNLIIPS
jgi:hypothetical protein